MLPPRPNRLRLGVGFGERLRLGVGFGEMLTCWGSGAVLRHFEKNMCPFLTASYTNSEARICILLTHSDRKHSEFSKTV